MEPEDTLFRILRRCSYEEFHNGIRKFITDNRVVLIKYKVDVLIDVFNTPEWKAYEKETGWTSEEYMREYLRRNPTHSFIASSK